MDTITQRLKDLPPSDRALIENVKAAIRTAEDAADAAGRAIHRAITRSGGRISYGMLSHETGHYRENLYNRQQRYLRRIDSADGQDVDRTGRRKG